MPLPAASLYTLRLAGADDAAALLAIYAPYITDTVITFEVAVPTVADFAGRIRKTLDRQLPWLLAEVSGQAVGYAYASVHNERAAYQWSVNVSVYVQAAYHGTGVARQLYEQLLALLTRQGYVTAYAGITLPNPRSEGFHRRFGFEPVGTYRQVGYKAGGWHDVQWLSRQLRQPPAPPAPPRSVAEAWLAGLP